MTKLSPDFISGLTLGLVTIVVALITLWQNRKRAYLVNRQCTPYILPLYAYYPNVVPAFHFQPQHHYGPGYFAYPSQAPAFHGQRPVSTPAASIQRYMPSLVPQMSRTTPLALGMFFSPHRALLSAAAGRLTCNQKSLLILQPTKVLTRLKRLSRWRQSEEYSD